MTERPTILVVDDEKDALDAMCDALNRRFDKDYHVEPHISARAALDAVSKMLEMGREIALVVADQRMPEMTGREFLGQVRSIVPSAKRALLVGWGDHEASPTILQACALGELDNYLYKPWAPAEVHLYPLIGEFLAEWTRSHRPGMELVHIVADDNSPRSHEICELLERNGIPYGFHPANAPAANRFIEEWGFGDVALPAVFLPDGTTLANPTNAQIMDAVGESPQELVCDVVVVGAGPAGLTAAVYAGSEGLRTLVVEKHVIGGQAGASSLIRNYLGFPRGISGADLTQRAYQQAWLFGAKFVFGREVTGLHARHAKRVVTLSDGREIVAKAVIVATGAKYRRLEIPSLDRFLGRSIFYTTFGESRFMRDFAVAVVGGGNSAGQAVLHLAEFARQVTLVVRGNSLEKGMSDYLVRQIKSTPNIEVKLNSEIVGGDGGLLLERIEIRNKLTGVLEECPVRLLFVLIGALPNTDWLSGVVQRNNKGFVPTGYDLKIFTGHSERRASFFETSMPGVFAAGDVRLGSPKRVAAAVGEGAGAVQDVHQYLSYLDSSEPENRDLASTLNIANV